MRRTGLSASAELLVLTMGGSVVCSLAVEPGLTCVSAAGLYHCLLLVANKD